MKKEILGTDKKVLSVAEYRKFKRKKKNSLNLIKRKYHSREKIEEFIMFGAVEELQKEYKGNYKKIEEDYSIDFLHIAAEHNSTISMKFFVEELGLDINKKNEREHTPLQVAINEGNVEIVKYLLEKNVDIEEPDPEFYLNAFYLALQNGMETTEESKNCCYEIALLLLKKDAKVLEEYQDGSKDFPNIELIYNLKKESCENAKKVLKELKKEYKGWLK